MLNMPENDSMPMGGNEPEEAEYAVEAVKNLKDLLARGLAEEIFRKICPSAATGPSPETSEQDEGTVNGKEIE